MQICSNFNISPEDLFWKWEAFSYNNTSAPTGVSRTIRTIDLDGARAFRAAITREFEKAHETVKAKVTRGRGVAPGAGLRVRPFANVAARPAPAMAAASGVPRNAVPTRISVEFVGPKAEEISKRNCELVSGIIIFYIDILDRSLYVGNIIRAKSRYECFPFSSMHRN